MFMVAVTTIRSRKTFFVKVKARNTRHAALRAERRASRVYGEVCIADHVAKR